MKDQRILAFLKALNETGVIAGEWVRSSCPLAFAKHKNGKDSNPSFGITRGSGVSIGNCFSCGFSGELETLLAAIKYERQFTPLKKKVDFLKAYEVLAEAATDGSFDTLPDYEELVESVGVTVFPEMWLQTFIRASKVDKALNYLTKVRGLTPDEVDFYDFRYDSTRNGVCIPFRDFSKALVGLRGRSIEGKEFHDYKYNGTSNTKYVWLGENLADHTMPIVLCEGQFDYIKIRRYYPNVLSGLTASVTDERLKKLEYFPSVIGFWDNDKAGKTADKKCADYLKSVGINYTSFDYNSVGSEAKDEEDPDKLSEYQIKKGLLPLVEKPKFNLEW